MSIISVTAFKEWLGDIHQRALTSLVNRTFKKDPGLLDKLAGRLLLKMVGQTPHDPELDHPEE